jgi:hypothetical protein
MDFAHPGLLTEEEEHFSLSVFVFVLNAGRCCISLQRRCIPRSFEVVGPVTRLVQAGVVDALELHRPVLRQRIEPPIDRHNH